MPRFNVQHPVTKEWRCFSTIVDDYVTDWMDEERYQRWRLEQYGKQAGEIRDANLMDYEEAEQIIADRKQWDAEEEGETLTIVDVTKENECCCSCIHNKRTFDKDYHCTCTCELDGHYIGYVANFESVCEEWEGSEA